MGLVLTREVTRCVSTHHEPTLVSIKTPSDNNQKQEPQQGTGLLRVHFTGSLQSYQSSLP